MIIADASAVHEDTMGEMIIVVSHRFDGISAKNIPATKVTLSQYTTETAEVF